MTSAEKKTKFSSLNFAVITTACCFIQNKHIHSSETDRKQRDRQERQVYI